MTKRLMLAVVALALVMGVGVYLLLPPKPGVTLENVRRVHLDMSFAEVEQLLGKKSADIRIYDGVRGCEWRNEQDDHCQICFRIERDPPYDATSERIYVMTGGYYNRKWVLLATVTPQPEPKKDRVRRWVNDLTGW